MVLIVIKSIHCQEYPLSKYDHILIIASDIFVEKTAEITNFFDNIEKLKQQGKQIAIIRSKAELDRLAGKIGPNTRIDILAHGNKTQQPVGHSIYAGALMHGEKKLVATGLFLSHLTRLAGEINWDGVQVHLWSCFGSSAITAIKQLPAKVTFITHGSSNSSIIEQIVSTNLIASLTDNHTDPVAEFTRTVTFMPEESAFAYQDGDQVFAFSTPMSDEVLISDAQTRKFIKQRVDSFHRALLQYSPQFSQHIPVQQTRLTQNNLATFRQELAYLHAAFDQDIRYIQNYLQQSKLPAKRFAYSVEHMAHIACYRHIYYQDNRLLELLAAEKASFNVRTHDSLGVTPLMIFAAQGHLAGVNLLIGYHADVNFTDKTGMTPLMQAAINGHESTTKSLLAAGADPTLLNQYGDSALTYAKSLNHHALVNLLNGAIARYIPVSQPDAESDIFYDVMTEADHQRMKSAAVTSFYSRTPTFFSSTYEAKICIGEQCPDTAPSCIIETQLRGTGPLLGSAKTQSFFGEYTIQVEEEGLCTAADRREAQARVYAQLPDYDQWRGQQSLTQLGNIAIESSLTTGMLQLLPHAMLNMGCSSQSAQLAATVADNGYKLMRLAYNGIKDTTSLIPYALSKAVFFTLTKTNTVDEQTASWFSRGIFVGASYASGSGFLVALSELGTAVGASALAAKLETTLANRFFTSDLKRRVALLIVDFDRLITLCNKQDKKSILVMQERYQPLLNEIKTKPTMKHYALLEQLQVQIQQMLAMKMSIRSSQYHVPITPPVMSEALPNPFRS